MKRTFRAQAAARVSEGIALLPSLVYHSPERVLPSPVIGTGKPGTLTELAGDWCGPGRVPRSE